MVVSMLLLLAAGTAGATAPATLRTDGIGPLHLGMTQAAGVATGWLGKRGTGVLAASSPGVSIEQDTVTMPPAAFAVIETKAPSPGP